MALIVCLETRSLGRQAEPFAELKSADQQEPKEVVYNAKTPPEFFNCIIVDVFKDHVGNMSVKSIIRMAKERRPGTRHGTMRFAEAMIIAYNAKNKYLLSFRKLYGGKVCQWRAAGR